MFNNHWMLWWLFYVGFKPQTLSSPNLTEIIGTTTDYTAYQYVDWCDRQLISQFISDFDQLMAEDWCPSQLLHWKKSSSFFKKFPLMVH